MPVCSEVNERNLEGMAWEELITDRNRGLGVAKIVQKEFWK